MKKLVKHAEKASTGSAPASCHTASARAESDAHAACGAKSSTPLQRSAAFWRLEK